YGPFAPNAMNEPFPAPDQARRDFHQLRELGANVLRLYNTPPRWFLDLATEFEVRLFIDILWNKERCFLDSEAAKDAARKAIRSVVQENVSHAAVFAYSLVNEVPADIVRWSGARAVADFIDELAGVAKSVDPDCLCTFGNFPPTEFLRPRNVDFISFNIYLHNKSAYENYLMRLQMIADEKPLLISEFGIDSYREGESAKCEMLAWQIEATFRSGLAGTVVFNFTDDWYASGSPVEDWSMGLTTKDRDPKPSFEVVQKLFHAAPYFPPLRCPKVSVVVACYNGARTLKSCLDSLQLLNYPDYEVILVDDGSTDATPQITSLYTNVRYFRQANRGLSVARNVGIQAAVGEIIAFTDADCRADEDWLFYIVGDLAASPFLGMGGHNLLPPEDSPAAAAVLVSPGGPAHVMLTDRIAEHIPGCNMVFYKWALEEIGGFDPVFTKAGDDVDLCWRLQQRGHRIGFNSAGFVWHYRRSNVHAYLKQQHGYGEAEALLVRKHPEYFSFFGGSIWRGRIYSASNPGLLLKRPIVYHGLFGTAFFQTLYSAEPAFPLMFCTSLEYHVLLTLPLAVLSVPFRFLWPVALLSFLLSLGVCAGAALQAELPKSRMRWWSRPLVALLFFLQPIVRGWARYQGRLHLRPTPEAAARQLESLNLHGKGESLEYTYYWAKRSLDRITFLNTILAQLEAQGWPIKSDTGWCEYDIEIYGSRWCRLQLTTAAEQWAGPNKMFRCRLRAAWSLAARLLFWSVCGFELLVIGFVRSELPYLWMLLLTMPLFAWYLEQEKHNLEKMIAAFLDNAAKQMGMTKLEYKEAEEKFSPVEPLRPAIKA
ncbi:MAG TPA: glycosyltransferase, partial [Verrucomicrobiae bacterium]